MNQLISKKYYHLLFCVQLLLSTLLFSQEQTNTKPPPISEPEVQELEEVVTIGSRRSRTQVNSLAPVDVVSAQEIQASGYTQVVDILQNLLPSFNAAKNSINDGTDYVRPATLRGLGPEHVLLLINGKRRHTSALVHVNDQTRGSVSVDLNTIPATMISRVEVLRDGAAAQYGSDAIAGVINIVLKKTTDFTVSASYGNYLSEETTGYAANEGLLPGEANSDFTGSHFDKSWVDTQTKKFHTDGSNFNIHLDKGFNIGKNGGIIHVAAQLRSRGGSSRAGIDPRMQYFAKDAAGKETTDLTKAVTFDPRESTFDRNNHWYGKSQLLDISAFLNGSLPFKNGNELYFFGGYSYRDGLGPCYYRRSLDNRTIRSIYPDGFLPNIAPIIGDGSFTAGYKGEIAQSKWTFDLSSSFGTNSFNFRVKNTANTSLASTDPLQKNFYDAGTLTFSQLTNSIDVSKAFDVGFFSDLNVAIGAEYRIEWYAIAKGEEASYLSGGVPVVGGPNAGRAAAAGCQCFPGYNDNSVTNAARSNLALYVDLESDFSKSFSLGIAGRYEYYSDFGSTINGKLSLRWAPTKTFALRATMSTGFRAPGLAQAFFTSIATNTINNVLVETGTFPVNSPVAKALGATTLQAEKSINYSVGLTYKKDKFSLTIDGYIVHVLDRVVLSEDFVGDKDANGNDLLEAFLNSKNVAASTGRFFTNALDTRTMGIDIVGTYKVLIKPGHQLDITLAANVNQTRITNAAEIETPDLLKSYTSTPLLGRLNRILTENFTPSAIINFSLKYKLQTWSFLLRNTYYGEQIAPNFSEKYDQKLPGTVITTLEIGKTLGKQNNFVFAIGADNLFDIYPLKLYKGASFNGVFQHSTAQPYGFMGRYVYIRFQITL